MEKLADEVDSDSFEDSDGDISLGDGDGEEDEEEEETPDRSTLVDSDSEDHGAVGVGRMVSMHGNRKVASALVLHHVKAGLAYLEKNKSVAEQY